MREFTICFFFLICFLGCEQNNYEITKDEKGSIYRLNKKTGELTLIQDGVMIPLKNKEEIALDSEQEAESLASPYSFGPYKVSGKELVVSGISSWRNGKIYLKVNISPEKSLAPFVEKIESLKKKLANLIDQYNRSNIYNYSDIASEIKLTRAQYDELATDRIILEGIDKNGIGIKEFVFQVIGGSNLLDEKGEIESREYQINDDLDKATYKAIQYFNIKWALHDEYYINEKKDKVDGLSATEG